MRKRGYDDNCPACLKSLPSAPYIGRARTGNSHTRRRFCDVECCDLFNEQEKPEQYFAMSHEEIATVLGISKQAVQQIERAALKKLRKRAEIYL